MAITTADIHAAADRIAGAGQQPTLAAVRSALGGGSFTTISEAMKSWKAAQAAAVVGDAGRPEAKAHAATGQEFAAERHVMAVLHALPRWISRARVRPARR